MPWEWPEDGSNQPRQRFEIDVWGVLEQRAFFAWLHLLLVLVVIVAALLIGIAQELGLQ
ncbi:MAG: hypothetical protein KGJ86_03570 [Chloroflexota bacterium]|nr:hypothetical protein [Chloroflexota bacterium]